MSRVYERSTRPKYPLPPSGLRQVNTRLRPQQFDQLLQLKDAAAFTGATAAFVRELLTEVLEERTAALHQGEQ